MGDPPIGDPPIWDPPTGDPPIVSLLSFRKINNEIRSTPITVNFIGTSGCEICGILRVVVAGGGGVLELPLRISPVLQRLRLRLSGGDMNA